MNPGDRARDRPPAPRVWLRGLVGVLAVVLVAVAYVQWRQYKLLANAEYQGHEALGWSFSQLQTEQLRLVNALQRHVDDPQKTNAERVRLRYEIFVSRIGVVDHDRAAAIVRAEPDYPPAIAKVRQFVELADMHLGPDPTLLFDRDAARKLLGVLETLTTPLHEMSLGAAHLLYQRATARDLALQRQATLGIALTVSQLLLLVALAVIVLRQVRSLNVRRRDLEALTEGLSSSRQDAEAASRSKSVFLANMSHEIRTPFHGMLGMMSLLQDSGLTPRQSGYLDTARDSAQHLLTILNDILDISQLESGKLQVTPETVDLLQLVAQVDALMRAQAHAKGLALRVDVAPDVPRWVRADPTRLKQILFNLMSNALKFTNSGTIALDVTIDAKAQIVLRVIDSGIGMNAATLARLFQRFVQGDDGPSRRANGASLGLEISRDLARLMGGDITVSSESGRGSTFAAVLPLPSIGAPALVSRDAGAANSAPARALRVLVAEDHPVNRAYMEAVLEKLGHHATFMTDGGGAVRAVEDQPADEPFDIILMDLHMPGMDGFSAARAIRRLPPPRGRVPIVALTADAFQESRHLASEAGMDGYLTKPAHLPQLRDALVRYGNPHASSPPPVDADGTAAAPCVTSNAVLDQIAIQTMRESLSPGKHAALLGALRDGWPSVLDQLRQCAVTPRPADLRALAHSLKGAALNLGLRGVGELAGELHASAPDASSAELLRRIEALEQKVRASFDECVRIGLLPGAGDASARFTPPLVQARA
ncbi:MAG: ATP-binding protein [Burkholderiaceae bacterium]